MESQSLHGIAVGRSNDLDCMMMYCPFNQKVYHTNNYKLDESGHTATSFNLCYDGRMFIGLYSSDKCSSSLPELYPPGTVVSFLHHDGVRIQGSVISVPVDDPSQKSTSLQHTSYTIHLVDGTIEQVSPSTMASITHNKKDLPTLHSSQLVLPQWIGDSQKVTLELDGQRHLGRIILDNNTWKF
eukprot:9310407-Ditylum_brightwellii.AAC.1